MGQNTIRRLSADILGIGESRVRFKPEQMSRINEALTRDDIRGLISEGIIYALPKRGVSRGGARERDDARRSGRRSGHGRRKGTQKARVDYKHAWMAKVRSQRKLLRSLRDAGAVAPQAARKIYTMIKGNAFRGKAVMRIYLKENGMLNESALAAMDAKRQKFEKKENTPVSKKSNSAPAPASKPGQK